MYALISELNEPAAVHVMHLWRELNQRCGLEGIFNYPNPHFTWFSAEAVDVDRSIPILKMIAESAAPFEVQTSGIGLFPGDSPVLYLPVVKTNELISLHRLIWDQILPYAEEVNTFYSSATWVPHITLALRDLSAKNLPCALQVLAGNVQEMAVRVNSFSLVKSENQTTGETLAVFDLTATGGQS